MAFNEFCDDIMREELPEPFEGGNNRQRRKLNVIVKFIRALRDSCGRRKGDEGGGGGLPDTTFTGWICVDGESVEYTIVGEPRQT